MRGEHAVAAAFVALHPLLPATWGHPEAVDQHDGVWGIWSGGVLGGHRVLLTSLSLLDSEGAPCEGAAHPRSRQASIRRREGASPKWTTPWKRCVESGGERPRTALPRT